MEAATSAHGALAEAVGFLSYFKDLKDSRQPGKVAYPLDEILLLCLLAVLAGAETIVDIALFGQKKLALLQHSPVRGRHPRARPSGRYSGHAGYRTVPELLCRLGKTAP